MRLHLLAQISVVKFELFPQSADFFKGAGVSYSNGCMVSQSAQPAELGFRNGGTTVNGEHAQQFATEDERQSSKALESFAAGPLFNAIGNPLEDMLGIIDEHGLPISGHHTGVKGAKRYTGIFMGQSVPILRCTFARVPTRGIQVKTPRLVGTQVGYFASIANVTPIHPQHSHDRDIGLRGKPVHDHLQHGIDRPLLRDRSGNGLKPLKVHTWNLNRTPKDWDFATKTCDTQYFVVIRCRV